MQHIFDINKFKPGKGILFFPISLAKIENAQSARKYFEEYIPHITPSKIVTPTIGANFVYGDWLYMWDDSSAVTLKKKYTVQMCQHKRECDKYIWKPQIHLGQTQKDDASYYIPDAFNFMTWSSLYFDYGGDFSNDLAKLYKIYLQDTKFQDYMQYDCAKFGRQVDEKQIMFFLEEHLMFYLIAKGKVVLQNEYVPHHNRILIAYPGKAPKHYIYLMQQDFFKLGKSSNVYEMNRYDLADKKLYDFTKIDLDTYDY